MKKLLLLIFLPLTIMAQDTTKTKGEFNYEFTISSRNIWRGASYGDAPSIKGMFNFKYKNLELNSSAVTTTNGNKFGYGSWIENYAGYSINEFTIGIDDYFFFNPIDSTNNFFDYNKNITQHFIEAQVKYSNEKVDLFAGYVIYSNKADITQGLYLEATYKVNNMFSLTLGGITGASNLTFINKAGINNVGITVTKEIQITNSFKAISKASLIANPSYREVQKYPSLGNNPIYFAISLTF